MKSKRGYTMKEKLIFENDKCKFFSNFLCDKYKGYNILLAEFKDTKERAYVVIKNGFVVEEDKQIEGIWFKIDMLSMVKEYERDN